MKIDEMTRMKTVIALDVLGWEQDGNKLCFVNVGGDGTRKTFKNWSEVLNFAVMLAKNHKKNSKAWRPC